MVAAALVIVGLAGPVLDAGDRLPGSGPVLLVIDDGWAVGRRLAAADGGRRRRRSNRAERAGRQVALLATAPSETGAAPQRDRRRCR